MILYPDISTGESENWLDAMGPLSTWPRGRINSKLAVVLDVADSTAAFSAEGIQFPQLGPISKASCQKPFDRTLISFAFS